MDRFVSALMCSLCAALAAQTVPDAAVLLSRADEALGSDSHFSMRLENLGKSASLSEYDCYNRGSSRFLMIFRAPAIRVGQAQLKVDDAIYFYNRKADKTIQMSAKAQFANYLFSQEDVMSRRLSAQYAAESVKETQVNAKAAYALTLVGKTKDVAYARIVAYLSKDSGYPIRREYYSFSGQLIKVLTFDELELDAQGRASRVVMTMADAVIKGNSTRATIDDFEYKPVDDRYFSRSYLKVLTQ